MERVVVVVIRKWPLVDRVDRLLWDWQLNRWLDEDVRWPLVLMQVETVLMLLDVAEDVRLCLLGQLPPLYFRRDL